jgi:hypothetical protein
LRAASGEGARLEGGRCVPGARTARRVQRVLLAAGGAASSSRNRTPTDTHCTHALPPHPPPTRHARCAPGDLARERGAVLEELRLSRDSTGRAQAAHWEALMRGCRCARAGGRGGVACSVGGGGVYACVCVWAGAADGMRKPRDMCRCDGARTHSRGPPLLAPVFGRTHTHTRAHARTQVCVPAAHRPGVRHPARARRQGGRVLQDVVRARGGGLRRVCVGARVPASTQPRPAGLPPVTCLCHTHARTHAHALLQVPAAEHGGGGVWRLWRRRRGGGDDPPPSGRRV